MTIIWRSPAAPIYFPPEILSKNDPSKTFVFVDGGA
jgi:patatin-like phospholipase/acyl hydrolase